MSNNHNPPAFPVSVPGHLYGDGSSEMPYVSQEGMTLRDYFAAKGLAALIQANGRGPSDFKWNDGSPDKPLMHNFCTTAYAIADMMLEARAQHANSTQAQSDDPG